MGLRACGAYEITGDVGRVVFPCGWVDDEANDRFYLYYGAADTIVAVATASFSAVLERVRQAPATGSRRLTDDVAPG